MAEKKLLLAFYLTTVVWQGTAIAQNISRYDDFLPREITIFEDDLSKNVITMTPKGWKVKLEMGHFRDITPGYEKSIGRGPGSITFKPEMDEPLQLPDSFTFECEIFYLDAVYSEGPNICIYHSGTPDKESVPRTVAITPKYCYCFVQSEKRMETGNWEAGRLPYYSSTPLKFFDLISWHHFAISYHQHKLKYYIDGRCIAVLPEVNRNPDYLELSNWGPVKYRKVRLAVGKEINPFREILTEEKFITHAINFDIDKATIIPECMDYVRRLALLLAEHPAIRLEIDGHADNSGSQEANLKLSLTRANEVKKQLVNMGVDEYRLQTKGFGDTKPLKPNTTPQGKGINRRVEFVRL